MFIRKNRRPGSLLAQVRYRSGKADDLVVFAPNIAGLSSDENANSGLRPPGFPKFVLNQHDRLCFAVNVDGNAFFLPGIDDAVWVAMAKGLKDGSGGGQLVCYHRQGRDNLS